MEPDHGRLYNCQRWGFILELTRKPFSSASGTAHVPYKGGQAGTANGG